MRENNETRRGGNLGRAPERVCSAADTRKISLGQSKGQDFVRQTKVAPLRLHGLPESNTQEAVDFLIRYRGSEPIVLTAITPDDAAPTESATFRPAEDVGTLTKWIDERQGKKNLYFTVNPTLRPMKGLVKAKKTHIRGMTTLHVDLD